MNSKECPVSLKFVSTKRIRLIWISIFVTLGLNFVRLKYPHLKTVLPVVVELHLPLHSPVFEIKAHHRNFKSFRASISLCWILQFFSIYCSFSCSLLAEIWQGDASGFTTSGLFFTLVTLAALLTLRFGSFLTLFMVLKFFPQEIIGFASKLVI